MAIRDAIVDAGKLAIGRLVLTTREHMIALEPKGKGLMRTLLRHPYEARDEAKAKHFKPERPNGRRGPARRTGPCCAGVAQRIVKGL